MSKFAIVFVVLFGSYTLALADINELKPMMDAADDLVKVREMIDNKLAFLGHPLKEILWAVNHKKSREYFMEFYAQLQDSLKNLGDLVDLVIQKVKKGNLEGYEGLDRQLNIAKKRLDDLLVEALNATNTSGFGSKIEGNVKEARETLSEVGQRLGVDLHAIINFTYEKQDRDIV